MEGKMAAFIAELRQNTGTLISTVCEYEPKHAAIQSLTLSSEFETHVISLHLKNKCVLDYIMSGATFLQFNITCLFVKGHFDGGDGEEEVDEEDEESFEDDDNESGSEVEDEYEEEMRSEDDEEHNHSTGQESADEEYTPEEEDGEEED